MATTREHETEIARLQSRLSEALARLDAIDPAAHEYNLAADDAIAAAQELVSYEDRLPTLLDERPRQITMVVVGGCGAATMVLAAAIALGVVPGGRPWWWLPIAVLLAVAGARLLMTRVRRAQLAHQQQRPPAVLVLAGAIAAGAAELGLLTAPLIVLAVVLVVAGVTLSLPRPTVQLRDLSSGQRIDVEFDSDVADGPETVAGDEAATRPAGTRTEPDTTAEATETAEPRPRDQL